VPVRCSGWAYPAEHSCGGVRRRQDAGAAPGSVHLRTDRSDLV